jgi:hypothetical protein
MCNDQANAKPNTHTVISATLEVQSNSVRIQPPATTLSTSQQTSSSTLVTSTRSATSAPTSSPSLLTSTGAPPIPAPAKTQPPAESQTTAPVTPPTESPKLSKPQIVGITVAAAGGGAVMLGIIAILACVKRRQRMDYRDSDELPLSMDPSYYPASIRSKKSLRKPMQFGPGGTSNGVARKVAPPVPRRLDAASPNMFSRRSMQPDQIIGLAISPELNQTPITQRPRGESKLLPPKPTLRLQMPPKAAAKFSKTAPKPMTFNRESTMTTFDEDFERPGWAPQIPPTPKFVPATLQGVGLSFTPQVAERPALRRESTATLFEDVEENGIRKSQVGNARGVSYIPPAVIQAMPVPRQSTDTPLELDSAPLYTAYKARQSSATQFEEDGAGNMTIGPVEEKTDRQSRIEQDLDNTIDEWERYTPINTSGPPAFYFTAADVQSSEVATANTMRIPVSQAKPVIVGRKLGSFSQPRNPNEYPPRKDSMEPGLEAFPKPPRQMPLQLKIPVTNPCPITAASSVYTTPSSSLPGNSPTPSLPPTGSLPQIPQAYRQAGPYDGPKTGNSMVSFESNNSISPAGPRTGELQLSPVFESPASGRSRVSYPKIPKPGRLEQGTITAVPPPSQPNFAPTLMSEAKKPWEAAESAARERERRIQLRRQSSLTGPPQGIMIHLPTTRSQDTRLSTVANFSPQSPNWDVYTPTPISASGPSFSSSNLPFARAFHQPSSSVPLGNFPLSQEPTLPVLDSPFTSPRRGGKVQDPTPNTPGIRLSRASSGLSHISETSQDPSPSIPNNAAQSQLAARRRGNGKASALTLSNEKKWRVTNEASAAKSPMWRPMVGTDRDLLSPDSRRVVENGGVAFERMGPAELPGTPGWVPKLTPTRKGDDLYLRVA